MRTQRSVFRAVHLIRILISPVFRMVHVCVPIFPAGFADIIFLACSRSGLLGADAKRDVKPLIRRTGGGHRLIANRQMAYRTVCSEFHVDRCPDHEAAIHHLRVVSSSRLYGAMVSV
jgi:hypothetical protein